MSTTSWMDPAQLRIGQRLGLVFVLVIAALAALALYGSQQIAAADGEIDLLSHDRLVKLQKLDDIKQNLMRLSNHARDSVMADSQPVIQQSTQKAQQVMSHNAELLGQLRTAVSTAEGKERLDEVLRAREHYNGLITQLLELAQRDKDEQAEALILGDFQAAQDGYFKALDGLVDLQQLLARKAAENVSELASRARWHLQGGAALAGAATLLLAWLVTRSITRPLRQAVGIAQQVAEGDLTQQIRVEGRDEAADLLRTLARMSTQLAGLVEQVRRSSDSIATCSGEIATGNADLSQRTESQASSLQQTAASMEQLHGTVQRNADAAQQAGSLARGANDEARQGGRMMDEVVQTMERIADASRRIADITGVIDGIAFQTNILALNAAVEAARAGEQGRGFAVVATEVRELALRSANAAREIKQLIADSVDRVEAGSHQVGQVGDAIKLVVQRVGDLDALVQGIASGSVEQSRGVGQINEAVTLLDQTTQQNAALVEQSAAATESLRNQAQALVQAVSVFRLHQ